VGAGNVPTLLNTQIFQGNSNSSIFFTFNMKGRFSDEGTQIYVSSIVDL
jgi:hypothetical protein